MSIICQGITQSGRQCQRKLQKSIYCYQHRKGHELPSGVAPPHKYLQEKPAECIICCESLAKQKRALECGHWIHLNCIINSAKAECPICRTKLNLSKSIMKRIEKLAKKRRAEYLAEEEEELRVDLQYQVAGLIAPALRDRIHEVIGSLLDEADDINATDVLSDIFDDDTYQGFLQSLMGAEILQTDIFEVVDSDSENEYDSIF